MAACSLDQTFQLPPVLAAVPVCPSDGRTPPLAAVCLVQRPSACPALIGCYVPAHNRQPAAIVRTHSVTLSGTVCPAWLQIDVCGSLFVLGMSPAGMGTPVTKRRSLPFMLCTSHCTTSFMCDAAHLSQEHQAACRWLDWSRSHQRL